MTIVNVTLSFDIDDRDGDDVDDIAREIADMAGRRFDVVRRVEHIDRHKPRTYGDLYRADGYDPDADDDEDYEEVE